jgi:hypothetical protein
MRDDYAELIERRLAIPPSEGPDKVMTLADAVRRFTAPGMTLYIGAAHGRPSALLRELVRQWWGRTPGWTVALTGFGSPATALVLGGLVERIITTFIGKATRIRRHSPWWVARCSTARWPCRTGRC